MAAQGAGPAPVRHGGSGSGLPVEPQVRALRGRRPASAAAATAPTAVADTHTHLDLQDALTDDAVAAARGGGAAAGAVGVDVIIAVGRRAGGRIARVWATADCTERGTTPRARGCRQLAARPAAPPGGIAALDLALAEIDKLAVPPQVRGIGETDSIIFVPARRPAGAGVLVSAASGDG
jgi:TatD DNase family protein